jgi:hypothetical protein
MDVVRVILATTPCAMHINRMGSVKDVSLCTSFTSTPRSPKEELMIRTSPLCELPPKVNGECQSKYMVDKLMTIGTPTGALIDDSGKDMPCG